MSNLPLEIVKLLSVTLSREKQIHLEHDFRTYADATNFAIKSILNQRIMSKIKAEEALFDDITNRFMTRKVGSTDPTTLLDFGRRFNYSMVTEYVPQKTKAPTANRDSELLNRTSDEVRKEFVDRFSTQYVKDILRTASAEIARHRKLAKTLINLRGRIPHFKYGTVIVSGMLAGIDERAMELISLVGEPIPIPFDKRSRNREIGTLQDIAERRRRYDRVRLVLNKEGFLNIDIRVLK